MYLEISWGSTSEFTGGLPMNNLIGNCSSALSVIRGNFLWLWCHQEYVLTNENRNFTYVNINGSDWKNTEIDQNIPCLSHCPHGKCFRLSLAGRYWNMARKSRQWIWMEVCSWENHQTQMGDFSARHVWANRGKASLSFFTMSGCSADTSPWLWQLNDATCARVKTWYMVCGHPSHNGNPYMGYLFGGI